MNFTEEEKEVIIFALEYLHDADLSAFSMVEELESVMDKFGISYQKWE